MADDAPIGPEDLVGITFERTPTMAEITQLKDRIKAGFGADANVEITLRYQRVHIEIKLPIRLGNQPTSTSLLIPVPSETAP